MNQATEYARESGVSEDCIRFAINQHNGSSKDIEYSQVMLIRDPDDGEFIVVSLSDQAIDPINIQIDCMENGTEFTTEVGDDGAMHVKMVRNPRE